MLQWLVTLVHKFEGNRAPGKGNKVPVEFLMGHYSRWVGDNLNSSEKSEAEPKNLRDTNFDMDNCSQSLMPDCY